MKPIPIPKEYRSRETVLAVEYVPGMEDGFVDRYYDPTQMKEDGSFSTWAFPSPTETAKMEVPYINRPEGGHILVGEGYMIITFLSGTMRSMTKEEFNSNYEEV